MGENFGKFLGPKDGCKPMWKVEPDPKDPKRALFTVYDSADSKVLATGSWELGARKPATYDVTDDGRARLNPPAGAQDEFVRAYLAGGYDRWGARERAEKVGPNGTNPPGEYPYLMTALRVKGDSKIVLRTGELDGGKRFGITVCDAAHDNKVLAVCVWEKQPIPKDGDLAAVPPKPCAVVITDYGRERFDLARLGKPEHVQAVARKEAEQPERKQDLLDKRVAWIEREQDNPKGDADVHELFSRSKWLSEPVNRQVTAKGWTSGPSKQLSWSALKAYLSAPCPEGMCLEDWREKRVHDLLNDQRGRVTPAGLKARPDSVQYWTATLYHWIDKEPAWPAALIKRGIMRP